MKTRLLLVPLCLAALAALAAGCGGGSSNSVPADAVAVVGSTPITKSNFNGLITVALARYQAQGQKAPKVGSSAYTTLKGQAVTYLVQEEELQQEAQKLGISVSQQDVNKRLDQIKQQYYGGSEKKLQSALQKDHITVGELEKYNVQPQLLSEKIYAKVTSSAKVSKADAQKYYNQNKSTFTSPPTREVRHILVDSKSLADQLETKLKNGASFATLAKQYSKDTTSAKQGGKLCVAHGGSSGACTQTVTPFDKAAFSLKTNEISQPVHSVYGWHIIQALTPVKPAHTQSFNQVQAQIQSNLAQSKKGQAWSAFLAKLGKDYKGKIAYQTGYTPPATTASTPGGTAPATTTG